MTLLIMSVFSPLLANDHEKCQLLEYDIISKKKADTAIKLEIRNTGNSKVNFKFNEIQKFEDFLMPDEEKEFLITSVEEKVVVTPLYIDITGNVYECRGKRTTINPNTLI